VGEVAPHVKTVQVALCSCDGIAGTPVTICKLVNKARSANIRVKMKIEGNTLLADAKREIKKLHVASKPAIALEGLAAVLRDVSKREINELALVLAYALMHLYDDSSGLWVSSDWVPHDGRWRTPQWTKQVLFFEHGKGKPRLDIRHPYLLTHLDDPFVNEPFPNFGEALEDAVHEAPTLLNLGLTLLDIQRMHLGIEDLESDDEININTELTRADAILEQMEADQKLDHWYLEAVKACLSGHSGDAVSMRNFIYKEIVCPLEMNLQFYSASPEQLQDQLLKYQARYEPQSQDVVLCSYGDEEIPIDPAKHVSCISSTPR
jgi:hypothetical protein